MSGKLVMLTFRVLQFVLGVAIVESLSSHFIGAGRCLLQAKSRRLSYPSSSIGFQRSTVPQLFPTVSSIAYRRRQLIFSSRQPYEEIDDSYDDFPTPKVSEMSEEEIRLRRMAKNTQNEIPRKIDENVEGDNYDGSGSGYYIDERDRGRGENPVRAKKGLRKSRLAPYDDSFDENIDYDDFYDDQDSDEEEPMAGNFWSNPMNSVDRPPAGIARRGRQMQHPNDYDYSDDDGDDDDVIRRSPRRRQKQLDGQRPARRRSPAQSGLGQPPKVFKDFYDQLFWYGFDADDSAEVGDNTIFGGTKGKFNGFNYLLSEENEGQNKRSLSSNNSVRRLPPSRNGSGSAMARDYGERQLDAGIDYDYNEDDGDDDDDGIDDRDYYRVEKSISKRKPFSSSSYTPPTDRASTRYDSVDEYDSYKNDDNESMDNGRTGRNNSARYNDEDEYMDRRSGGRRRRRQQNSSVADWSPLSMIESFLGIDREEMDYKADVYNAKMGLGKRRRSSSLPTSEEDLGRGRNKSRRLPQRRRSSRDDPERRGYAYRYDVTLDAESTPILDIHLAGDEDSESRRRQLSIDVDGNDETKSRKKERSWEERQIAMERVPPVDIMAWGPSGELPMSAREKAFVDAQEDIETARRKLNLMKRKESEVKEEITILKVDADRQRLKLSDPSLERRLRRDVEELRQIELDIDDASRELRQSRTKVDRALRKLHHLEERHHAIMSYYNIDQASSLVGESLNQFSVSIQGVSANTSTTSSNASSASTSDDITGSEMNDSKSDSIEN